MRRHHYMIWLIALVFALVICPVGTAFSSMISNGTFDVSVPSNGTGGEWTSSNIDGSGGWRSGGGNPGSQFIMNDNGNPNSDPVISQTVSSLNVGTTYILSWDLALHVNYSGGSGTSFGVFLDGLPLLLTEFLGLGWQSNDVSFVATNSSHDISFAAELDPRTPGVSVTTDVSYQIDNANLSKVPIPGTLCLFGSGLIGLVGISRKLRRK